MGNYAIACGGSGGHMCPGMAVAEELLGRGHRCVLIATTKKIDGVIVRKCNNLRWAVIATVPPAAGPLGKLAFALSQLRSFFTCLRLIIGERISCVIGMGGFGSVPAVLAAFVLGRKIVIHESNRIPGKCTRLLAHLANGILLPHGVDLERKSFAKKTVHVSIPLRREIGKMDRRSARENLHLNPDMATVVVLGGSQGADVLNGWARESMELLNWHGIAVCCVCGILSAGSEVIRGKSSDGKTIANVFMPFCDDMRSLLNGADLMVCRAGASTIAEAAALSIPMVLVPYAHAADGHQLANAMHAEGNGQAIVVLEENISTAGKMVLKFLLEKSRAPAAGAVTGERERSAVAVADYVENIVNGW